MRAGGGILCTDSVWWCVRLWEFKSNPKTAPAHTWYYAESKDHPLEADFVAWGAVAA